MDETPEQLNKATRIYVAGHNGLVGSALWRAFTAAGYSNLVGRSSAELDLRNREATSAFLSAERPELIVDAAARVGGIGANNAKPAEFLSDNLRIQLNLMDAAVEFGVKRFLFLGSSCVYPKFAPQPITEDALLTGTLEPTNDAYAIAKIAGILHIQAIRREFGLHYISAMPTNLYGPNDNFDLETSHVLPAMIRRFHEAKLAEVESVTLWGSGRPLREFLHVDDLAAACISLLEHYDAPEPINVGTGEDSSILEIAELVADVVGYRGRIEWDTEMPDGTPRKLLDVTKLKALGWEPKITLRDGLSSTYDWYLQETDPNGQTGSELPRGQSGN